MRDRAFPHTRRGSVSTSLGLIAVLCAALGSNPQTQSLPPPPAAPFVPNQLVVRVTAADVSDTLTAIIVKTGAVEVRGFDTVRGLYLITLPAGISVASAARLAAQLDGVAYAEPNYIVTADVVPDDPRFGEQWALQNTGQSGGTSGADIDAAAAWSLTSGSADVVVAVIDTGIDYTHDDLAANMFRNEADCNADGVDDDGNGFVNDCFGIDTANHDSDPRDDNNHGTHTAGTIGARGNNAAGVAGVNWNVKLMPCKFLDGAGNGTTAGAVACLDYVGLMKDRGVDIVATNNSWGGGGFSQALYDAIDAQRQRGILFVAAAGNAGTNNDSSPTYPASYDLPNVISVASTTRTDAVSSFSNRGRRTVHIGAPGSDILSTVRGNTYLTLSGTSMAAPHVAGVAALLKAQDPGRDWRAIKNLILAGGDANPNLSSVTVSGRRLNAFGALTCTGATVFAPLKPSQSIVTTTAGTGVRLSALNITCAAGAGNVAVSVSPGGQVVTLTDDGASGDQAAGDGIYTGSFVPASPGHFVLTWPNGETVTVHVLSSTAYRVQPAAFNYRAIAGTNLTLTDDSSAQITPPFPVQFGGLGFDTLFVNSNGNVTFANGFTEFTNTAMPAPVAKVPLVAAFWDDLVPLGPNNVFWDVNGAAPNRELVVEWRNVLGFLCADSERVTFELVFFEGRSHILFNYFDAIFGGSCASRDRGGSATIGVQSSTAVARPFSFNSPAIDNTTALLWTITGAAPSPFTDDPVTAGGTDIKAAHITELRSRIDAQRQRYGLAQATWTDATIVPGVTLVRAQHVIEMRAAVTELYAAAGLPPPAFTDSDVQPGTTVVRAAHLAELRAAIQTIETLGSF